VSVGFSYTKGTNNYVKVGSSPKDANPGAVGRGVVSLSCEFDF
jgi:hypothetical protein